jgi:RNA polymerase sigma-70 factor (ECF subfamily)
VTLSEGVRPVTPEDDRTVRYLLARWSEGEREAARRLIPIVYDELRGIAGRCFRSERRDHTLQPTAVVHEVCVRLLEYHPGRIRWQNRQHFFAVAASMMRRTLMDYGRRRSRQKRGGGRTPLPPLTLELLHDPEPEHLLELNRALLSLADRDVRKATIVELRFFAGLTLEETAECLGITPRTVSREWQRARAFLFHALSEESADGA